MRKLIIALFALLLAAPATAQQFPTVHDHTVIGRIGTGSGSGPSQEIPFASLFANLISASGVPNAVLVTDGSGNGAFSTTLPSSLLIPSPNLTGSIKFPFGANLPLFGGGNGSPLQTGTLAGNTTKLATASGSFIPTNCLTTDVNHNIVDNTVPCGTGTNTSSTQDFLAGTNFTAGTTTSLTVSSAPISAANSVITFDGVVQSHNTWTLLGSTFTFSAAIPLNTQVVEIGWLSTTVLPTFVTSIGGASGPISLGSNLSISGQTLNATLTGNNIVRNAGLGLVTNVATTLVGVPGGGPNFTVSQIALSGWAQQGGAGSANARFNSTSNFIAGLQPGKLVAIMGFSSTISFTATVTGSNIITATTPVFTGAVGDLIWNTGGTNHSSKSQWRIASLSGCSSGCTTAVVQGALVNEASVTFFATQIQGGYAINPAVNGMPQNGNPQGQAFVYYPLQVTAVGVNFFNAQLAGRNLNVGTSSSASAWEVTNGSMGTGCIGPDWWSCTGTLSFFKMRGTDWDGVTVVNKPGSLYSSKLIKGATTQELFYQDLQAAAPATVGITNYTGLANFQGKTLTCAAYIWAPNANEGRIFINDGATFTYSSFVTPGSYQWAEVTATLSNTATTAQFGMSMDTGTAGDVFFLTQPICKFGAGVIGVGNYQPAPPAFHMFKAHTTPFYYINQAVPANVFINIEQDTSGCIPSGMESIMSDIGGANNAVGAALQLSDGPGPPQMSALVDINPVNSATQTSNQTGQVAITKRGSGDGQFNIDSQWINTNGSATWTAVTVDYLGGVY